MPVTADGSESDEAEAGRSTGRRGVVTLGDRLLLLVGIVALAMSSVLAFGPIAERLGAPFFDWTFYSGAVDRWLSGNPIYPGGRISTLTSDAGASYAYPPASVPLMLPFASWPLGAVLWEALIVGSLLLGMWVVVRRGWPARSVRAMAITLVALAAFLPAIEGIVVANVNVATAGALGWVWAEGRGVRPLAGVMSVVKVFPIALAAPLGLRALGVAALVASAICLITLPLVGVQSWADYVSGLVTSEPLCGAGRFNPSLACASMPIVGPAMAKWIGLSVAAICLGIAVLAGRSAIGIAAVAVAIIAPATELHAHYLTLLFMVCLVALAEMRVRSAGHVPAAD